MMDGGPVKGPSTPEGRWLTTRRYLMYPSTIRDATDVPSAK